jgi:plastocyanin
MRRRSAQRPLAAAGFVAASAVLTGCSFSSRGDDLVNGKQQFVQNCGSCHVLARAGTRGQTGPNLDAAFRRARIDGMGESTFQGVVHRQIQQPARLPQRDPQTGEALPLMPANLVEGNDATDVAAYVAEAAGKPGKDTGQLASVGVKVASGTAREKGGRLDIPTAPGGGLAYEFKNARASAGRVTIESKNAQPVDHNIAVEGNGVDEKGAVVSNGGVSRFTVTLKPGTYTFYCSVPGHRVGGMVGKLVVAK